MLTYFVMTTRPRVRLIQYADDHGEQVSNVLCDMHALNAINALREIAFDFTEFPAPTGAACDLCSDTEPAGLKAKGLP